MIIQKILIDIQKILIDIHKILIDIHKILNVFVIKYCVHYLLRGAVT